MATCQDVVTRALRMARVVPREDDPEAVELRDGMHALQSLYDGWLTGGMFGRLTDVYEPADSEAGEGQRIYAATATITLPTEIDEDRKPRDLVANEIFDLTGRRAYIWDRTAWVRIDGLESSDSAPLADRGLNGLAACVAVIYAEEFGADLKPSTVMQARNFKTALSYKFGSERSATVADYF